MRFTVLLFARCREIVGANTVQMDIDKGSCCCASKDPFSASNRRCVVADSVTVRDLVTALVARYPAFAEMVATMVLSVNLNYVAPGSHRFVCMFPVESVSDDRFYLAFLRHSASSSDSDQILRERDEIALIPPVRCVCLRRLTACFIVLDRVPSRLGSGG